MTTQQNRTMLEAFLSSNRGRLAAAAGGAGILGVLLATPAPADPSPHIVSAAISDRQPIFTDGTATGAVDATWKRSAQLDAVLAAANSQDTIDAAAAAVVDAGDLDEIAEAISDKRVRLQNAMRELENLEMMVEVAQTLDPAERDEAVAAALLIYNEAVAGAEFDEGADLTERARASFEEAGSSTDLLLTLRPMQGR